MTVGAQAPAQTLRTVCSYCGVGCGITVTGGADGVVKAVGDREHPTNAGRLCTKGATHVDLMAAPGRLTRARVRPQRGEAAIEIALDEAIERAASGLQAVIAEHGPDAVAVYVSGQMSLEAQYLSNKLVKGRLRSPHIESNSRLCMASAGTGYKQSLGADGPPGSYEDIDHADLFFVIGSNTADCHPIVFLRMADRLKRGARMIVVDPRRTETAARADLHLAIAPGTDLALLNGLLRLLVDAGAIDEAFIAAHTDGWDAVVDMLADYPPERVAEITGLAVQDLRTAAAWIAEAGEWMTLWTMGLNQSTQGTWNTNAICNLHLATGAICRTGSGPFSLTGQPNAMGGREMGYMGPGLPGQRVAADPADRAFVEAAWNMEPGSLRTDAGSGTIDMFHAMADGDIKAAWIICTNPVASVANRRTVIEGLEAADLVIVQDVFADTATAAYADVLLPATLWVESEGVMIGSDRTLSLVQHAAPAPGEALPDWMLICHVAQALGYEGFDYADASEVFDEIRTFWNPRTGWDIRGIDYDRLRRGPVQWPAPAGDTDDRHPIRYVNDGVSQHLHVDDDGAQPALAFPTPSRRAQFHARPHVGPAELPDDDYPWVLNTGRLQHQWHTMTKTGKVDKLVRLNPDPFVEIHPTDAAAFGIGPGDRVEVASRRGSAVLPAVVTDRVRPGNCFAPFHWNDEQGEHLTVNAVTSDAVDAASLQPEFKFAAVSLRRVAAAVEAAPVQGLALPGPPTLGPTEAAYVSGFLTAIEATPRTGVPVVPSTAPLDPIARAWFDGLLAGRYADRAAPSADDGAAVTIAWGSQTGNAEAVARQCAQALQQAGIAARTTSMAELSPSDLREIPRLLVVTSTFGDGGPPDNAAGFWAGLSGDDAPALDGLEYAVFALGDPSYDDYCGYGRGLDARLAALGASPLWARVESDPDYEDAAATWSRSMVATLTGSAPAAPEPPAVRRMFTRANPVAVPLVRNVLLSGAGSAKEVRQFGFDVARLGVSYAAGDSLGVVCANPPALVEEFLEVTGLPADAIVDIDGREQFLDDALTTSLDITRTASSFVDFVGERSSDSTLAMLRRRENAARLEQHLWATQAIDLLREFPIEATAQEWADVLGRLQPRQYSISSSPKTSPHEIQLTVAVVRFLTDRGIRRGGVASSMLADADSAARVPVFLQRSPQFRPPEDADAPMIMIGPGTGVAPFRGFLHDRRADGHRGRNWLFFGEQHAASDFYYRDELLDLHADGFLTRLDTAFSRDQRQKIYVQDRMVEHGAELWRWLEAGAHVYVCGDASRMAADVDATLTALIHRHGGMGEDAAAEYKAQLVATGRYVRDVY
ncbi:molybdopterin-dependent oxidoreductase [Microbacterium sp. bgisy189]|uniref:molybdopterin-dependent oxidoreductase n=1 Tax=Microbacterium sp. bgisy189 TaxID=3413798 RepID=UPI003EBD4826